MSLQMFGLANSHHMVLFFRNQSNGLRTGMVIVTEYNKDMLVLFVLVFINISMNVVS